MTPDEVRLACLLGSIENLRCGATAIVQHHKVTTSPEHVDAAAEAAASVGLRTQLVRGWADVGETGESPDAIMGEMRRLLGKWHGAADGRISVGNGPLAPWRCSEDTMRRVLALARDWGAHTHLHVAETEEEVEMVVQCTDKRHVAWLASLDALGPDVQLVHCVCVDDVELDHIAATGSIVVHCPVSNMYLASGVAPVRAMVKRSIPVALGTDGPASHNSQDLLETLKVAALLARVTSGDAAALSTADALKMVTTSGARLFGRKDIGRLAPKAKADLTLVDLNNPRCMPVHVPANAVVYNASGPDVHTVIVDGRVLLDAGRVAVLDEARLLAECRESASRLLARTGLEVPRD
jgi:5-methylthioadenosine/S-adenosylhomocysteine deaminase